MPNVETYVTINDNDYQVEAYVEVGWEGDPSIPNGTRDIIDVDDIVVYDEKGADVTEVLTPEQYDTIHNKVYDLVAYGDPYDF